MSSQAKAAKDALDLAVTHYKYCNKLVLKSLQSLSPNERSLNNKMNALSEALSKLNIAHTSWVSKAAVTDDQLTSDDTIYTSQWLEACWDEVDDLQVRVDAILQPPAPVKLSNQQQLEIYSQQLDSLQQSITSKLDKLLEKTDPSSASLASFGPSSHQIFVGLLNDVQNQLSSELSTLADNILALDRTEVVKRCATIEEFRRSKQEDIVTIQLRLADISSVPPAIPSISVKSIEMEKSKAPSFSGKTIDYPEFKRGWAKVAGVHWDDGNQVEQIKYKVDQDTRRIISRCSTMTEVWVVLDAEFAQEQEVINAVDTELRKLQSSECSIPEYIVKLRNYLPNLEEALRAVDGLDHLRSPDRVNFLTQKFDERTLHEWDYFRSKSTGSTYERFYKFLVDRYDASRSSIARSKAATLTTLTTDTMSSHSISHTNATPRDTDCRKCHTWTARDKVYTCPGCGRGTPVGDRIHHCLEHCGAYMAMSANDRGSCIERAKWCPIHLLGTHSLSECNMTGDSRLICGVNGCTKHHHKSLHAGNTPFIANILSTQCVEDTIHGADDVLLTMQSLPSPNGSLNCLFDNAATCSLVTKRAANRLNLTGESIKLSITTVTGSKVIDSVVYHVPVIDRDNVIHEIKALQVDNISDDIKEVDVTGVKHLFSPGVQHKWDLISCRPVGSVDLLLGTDVLGLHPIDHEKRANLRVLFSYFGLGLVLAGSHPAIKSNGIRWSEDVSSIMHCAHASVNRLSVKPVYEYFESDSLGIQPPRRCGNCRNCKDCSFRGQMLSQKEQYEYQVIESKIKYESATQTFVVSYPFTADPSVLPDNKMQVIKIAEREEKRLLKSDLLDIFNEEFNKLINYGALQELSTQELDLWDGPKHYVSLQHVIKEDSVTTPLRIVTNSSLSDRKGLSLNSILMKGHDTLSDQWAVLNKWRSYEVALCSDVTKAYYSIRTGELEKHVRRVVWRYGDTSKEWKVFGFRTVSFGDRPAAAFLELAIRQTAQLNQHIDPTAADRICNDRYVDDLASGGTPSEVSRFVGNDLGDFQCDGTIPTILSKGSLRLKVMVASGETDKDKIDKLGGKVLGLPWDPCTDEIKIKFPVSLTTKDGSKLILSPQNFNSFDRTLLTPRNLLGIVNSLYDPLGLVAPITIKLRVAFRNLFRNNSSIEWDTPLTPGSDLFHWVDLLHLLVNACDVTFPRATKPPNVNGNCQLICYFDGSDLAYCGVTYIRWLLTSGETHVTLLCAKPRVTPLQRISTPRSELNGAVVASRLLLSAVRSLSSSGVVPERVWMIGDSECTLASLEKVHAPFGEFFGNRIGEIQDNQAQIEKFCPIGKDGEWWHTSSLNNAADQATRIDSSITDISADSVWQSGPSYLRQAPSEWPINRDFANRKDDCIPQMELLKRFRCLIQIVEAQTVTGIDQLIDPLSTNSWDKLIHRTQILLAPFHKKQFQNPSSAYTIKCAKRLWFLSAMPETITALDRGKLRELDILDVDGLKVVRGRASVGMQKFFGSNTLPVIMGSTRIAYLIMLHAHCKDHAGRDITVAMSRQDAWIVNSKQLAKGIVRSCVRCRYLRKQIEDQKMAVIPDILQVPCPPFTNIGIDLLGPLIVKAMTNKRACMKVWIVIFVCLNTKAVSMELASGYSTDDFLLAYSTHISLRGIPSFVHSDRGSQLIAAHKDLTDEPLRYDWDIIASSSSAQGTTWKFAPAGGQWRNGATEAFVKKFKLSFYHLYRETRFNFSELNCAVKRIANVLNDRPVSAQRSKSYSSDEDFLSPLTPNMLITGRNGSGPPCDYAEVDDSRLRRSYIEELEGAWWCQFKVQCFDSLVPTRKWIDAKRNMSVNDVVLIKYSSMSIPGSYRLGRVTDVETDADNLVRTCTVRYNLIKPVTASNIDTVTDVVPKEIRVPIQRLVLILPVEEQ